MTQHKQASVAVRLDIARKALARCRDLTNQWEVKIAAKAGLEESYTTRRPPYKRKTKANKV